MKTEISLKYREFICLRYKLLAITDAFLRASLEDERWRLGVSPPQIGIFWFPIPGGGGD